MLDKSMIEETTVAEGSSANGCETVAVVSFLGFLPIVSLLVLLDHVSIPVHYDVIGGYLG